eukprot:COSAG03_NODE_206_length_10644_cov_8.779896_11_plen_93_part_00
MLNCDSLPAGISDCIRDSSHRRQRIGATLRAAHENTATGEIQRSVQAEALPADIKPPAYLQVERRTCRTRTNPVMRRLLFPARHCRHSYVSI